MKYVVQMEVEAANAQAAVKKMKKDVVGLRPGDIEAAQPDNLRRLKNELDEIGADFEDLRERILSLCSEWESVPSVMAFLDPIYGDLGETYPDFDLEINADMIVAAIALEEQEEAVTA